MRVDARSITPVIAEIKAPRERRVNRAEDVHVVGQSKRVVVARQASEHKSDQDRLERTLSGLNQAMQALERQVRFERHESTGTMMVSIIDAATGEVVREIPPKKILDMVGRILQGLLVDEKA